MSLKLITALALKKIRFRKSRSLLLALPIVLLSVIVITIASWAGSFERKVTTEFMEPLKQSSLLINVFKSSATPIDPPAELKGVRPSYPDLTDNELSQIAVIDGVASMNYHRSLPYSMDIQLDGADADSYYTGEIISLDDSLAGLYGIEEFDFEPGQPIPVIAGMGMFYEEVYNFGDETVVEEPVIRQQDSSKPAAVDIVHHRDLINSNLIGTTGTFRVDFLPKSPMVSYTQKGGKIVNTLLDEDRRSEIQDLYNHQLKPYWSLEDLARPEEFAFEVVGINTVDEYSNATYMPIEAIVHIQNRLHQRQVDARTTTPLPAEILQEGVVGSIVQNEKVYAPWKYVSSKVPKESLEDVRLVMPGLVVKAFTDTHGTIAFKEAQDFSYTSDSFVGGGLTVRIDDPEDRQEVRVAIEEIDGLYAGGVDIDSYATVIKIISIGIQIATAVLSFVIGIIVFILCWGFANDANKEIGLLRAMGATGKEAQYNILWQLLLIFGVSVIIGLLISLPSVHIGAEWVGSKLNEYYLNNTVASLSGRNTRIMAEDLQSTDFNLVAPYLLASLILPILAAWIATRKNLKTDPLEALKMDG